MQACSSPAMFKKKQSCKHYLKTTVDFFFTSLQHACVFLIIIFFGGTHHQIYCLYTLTIGFVTSENSTTCSQQYCVLICLLISDSDHLMFQIVRS